MNQLNPKILQPTIDFKEEEISEVLTRYNRFAIEFIHLLNDKFRDITFMKDPKTDDVWGFVENKFGFQIDPDLEVIIIWSDKTNFEELGSWNVNPVNEALKKISVYLEHDI